MKIAVGGIHTECSTYSPLLQTMDDFRILRGVELLQVTGLGDNRFPDADFLPLFQARSIPGGPVEPTCYLTFKSRFLQELKAALPLEGVLLIMHGAMHVPGLDDVEGDWISAVRETVGPDIPIAVSYDLHGNVTQRIVDQIDIFCAYRTAPHIDVCETHLRAAGNLVDQLRGGPRRMVAWAPVPVLHPGERTSTEDEPAASLYTALSAFDRRSGVSDANLMIGYVWADTARATAAAVVTGTDPDAAAEAAKEIAAAYWANRAGFDFGVPAKPLPDCLEEAAVTSGGPFILADSGDNPTGGGVGDRSDVLALWLERGLQGGVFAGIADPRSVTKVWSCDEGTSVELSIGGAFGSDCPEVAAQVTVGRKIGSEENSDREVLVYICGNSLILTEKRRPFHNLEDFRRFGIEPKEAPVLIVKSGYLSPELAPLANPARMALTDGAVNQDICALINKHRTSPSYPFQTGFDWHPVVRLSSRVFR
ncbi:M81 family metallopeptidase [Roseibium marinum]|uniref:Microcystin degradation protein MlrC n=1 Tax=Roseibium marinum TaxID=281252 RepID=A0A2S3UP45_9HYPH|nr:M81 family metallopeptidase [Roseibium marinum]POF29313.1 microcystin degradation protein MlrC [Roseibium marinum]